MTLERSIGVERGPAATAHVVALVGALQRPEGLPRRQGGIKIAKVLGVTMSDLMRREPLPRCRPGPGRRRSRPRPIAVGSGRQRATGYRPAGHITIAEQPGARASRAAAGESIELNS
jgi:hypothetical protein